MTHFMDVTTEGSASDVINTMPNTALIIYSPTSLKAAGITKLRPNMVNYHTLRKDISQLDNLGKTQHYSAVLSLGGGTAIDIGKYAASLNNCPFICIPAMLSTNAYATNKAALMSKNKKVTFDAKTADKIIFDKQLISKAMQKNVFGLCDVLSIHTALFDWKLAEKARVETVDPEIYQRAQALLDATVHMINSHHGALRLLNLNKMYQIVGESGVITNIYGSGRPESGSEHIFARELERQIHVAHGISVTAGIVLMSRLQGNYNANIIECLKKLGTLQQITDDQDISNALKTVLREIRPRADRYSILDETKLPISEHTLISSDSLTQASLLETV